jgi:hypothetical protein
MASETVSTRQKRVVTAIALVLVFAFLALFVWVLVGQTKSGTVKDMRDLPFGGDALSGISAAGEVR